MNDDAGTRAVPDQTGSFDQEKPPAFQRIGHFSRAACDATCPSPIKILYILGTPYCGSSLFALALGTDPKILNLGEVVFMENDSEAGSARCTCGEPLCGCPFWGPLLPRYGPDGAGGLVLTAKKAERLDPLDRAPWPRSFAAQKAYRDKAVRFFGNVAAASGAEILVDASKSPRRLMMLAADPRLDVTVVRLTRPFWDVRKSYRARGRGTVRLALSRIMIAAAYWRMPRHKRLTVGTGALAKQPDAVMKKLSALFGRPVSFALRGGVLDTSDAHVFTGNRWMFRGVLDRVAIREATP